ncbi:MAG: hypothetical protein DRH04_05070 [Deltaproteobacteria bacterium]|nr:MAG: hypothetical protein DRH04_05070 [Deltaproteobacteria bacterium]
MVSLLLLTYRLDGTPFRGLYDDVDRSLIARNMVDSGDWLVARYLYGPLYTKPPLMYWTAAVLGVLTGRSDELPGNLASVLGMFPVILATFWAGRNLFGTRTGLWAGLILVTMHLFLAMGRQALLDTVMMGGFALTFGALVHLGFSGTRHRTTWWLVVALGLAISFMTKGPVILPVFLLVWLPMCRGNSQLRPGWRQVLPAVALILLIILPWPILLLNSSPEALTVWKSELFGRFGDGQQFHQWTQKPVWFYLPDLVNTLPWFLMLPWAIVAAFRERQDARFKLLLWWGVGGLVFFSLASATKRSYYLLPLYPAFALLIAGAWSRFVRRWNDDSPVPRQSRLVPLLTLLLLVGILGLVSIVPNIIFPHVAATPFIPCGIFTTMSAAMGVRAFQRKEWNRALAMAVCGTALVHMAYFGHFVPVANDYYSGKSFFAEAVPLIGEEEVVIVDVPLSISVFYLHGIPWQHRKTDGLADFLRKRPGVLVITRPGTAHRFPGLEPLLEREFSEPFGKKRGLGLYRIPPASPAA